MSPRIALYVSPLEEISDAENVAREATKMTGCAINARQENGVFVLGASVETGAQAEEIRSRLAECFAIHFGEGPDFAAPGYEGQKENEATIAA